MRSLRRSSALLALTISTALAACSSDGAVAPAPVSKKVANGLPDHATLRAALVKARKEANGGFSFDMWATVVDRSGTVTAVVFTGDLAGDQWLGSRVISAQKASAANAFSLKGFALSTANLYSAVQPGGSLYGLQFSNPVDPAAAYAGKASDYGTTKDPMVGAKIGGINVFGGGLGLYNAQGELVGAVGVSGDASCADHNIAWKVRDYVGLDKVPAGVANGTDNIVYDIGADGKSASGWGHPTCPGADATGISAALPTTNPLS
jgi:uncharacterized protein GlcG (DUF336 family)